MVRERFFVLFCFYWNLGKRPNPVSPSLCLKINFGYYSASSSLYFLFLSPSTPLFIPSFHLLSPFFSISFLLFKTDLSSLLSSLFSFFNLLLSFLFLSNQHNTHQNLLDLHTNRHFCLWSISVCPVKTATRPNTTLRFLFIYGLFYFLLPS